MSLDPKKILEVAHSQRKMFTNRRDRAARGETGYRLNECEHYLSIWQSIIEKNGENLLPDEQGEVDDAWYSGSYEDILGPAPEGEAE